MTVKYNYQLECIETGKKLHVFPFFHSYSSSRPTFAKVSSTSWVSEKKAESKLLEYNISKAVHGKDQWPEVKLVKQKIETTVVNYDFPKNASHDQLLKVLKHISESNNKRSRRGGSFEALVEWLSSLASMKKPIHYVVIGKNGTIPKSVKCSFCNSMGLLFMVVETEEDVMHVKLSNIQIGLIAHPDHGIIHKQDETFIT